MDRIACRWTLAALVGIGTRGALAVPKTGFMRGYWQTRQSGWVFGYEGRRIKAFAAHGFA